MNKQLIIIGGAIVLIIVVGLVILTSRSNTVPPQNSAVVNSLGESSPNTQVNPNAGQNQASGAAAASPNVRKFTITGTSYKFSLPEIRVKKGETVEVTFTNEEGFHDWKIDEFNAGTAVIGAGKSETVTFVANKVGTFEYYCSVANHRQNGMKGNLVVE
jgi:plastocyanin